MKEYIIPDDSSVKIDDGCLHSMWCVYQGNGKSYRFYCHFCCMIITVNFPRYSRVLGKVYEAEDVVEMHWVCPGCCKSTPALELLDRGTF